MEFLELALRGPQLGPYPHRPPLPLSASTSVYQLRGVLKRAGRIPENCYEENTPGVDRDEDYEENVSWDWTQEYQDEVYQALTAVIKEHGLGDAGWKSARWEVYDKVGPDVIRLQSLADHSMPVSTLSAWRALSLFKDLGRRLGGLIMQITG